jgi:GH24 family phage-related lysozyme (muramidase)
VAEPLRAGAVVIRQGGTSAAQQFDLWDHVGRKVLAGLLRRREAETKLFEEAD